MRVLFLDCFSGISGDMTVGALTDLGVKPSTFEWELSKLEIGDFHMHFERKQQQEIEGVKFSIHEGATHRENAECGTRNAECEHHSHAHDEKEEHHHHEHHEHHHGHEHGHSHGDCHGHEHEHGLSHAEIRALIEKSDLSAFVKQHALGIFQRIAVAEGKIHGVTPEVVQFHEVGGLDSIADVVCACAGIEQLGIEKVFAGELQDGRGWTDTAHGRFPVPAPATLEILKGISLTQCEENFEMITPTGAGIIAEFAASFGPMPRMKIAKVGYGLGSRKGRTRPNVLRAVLGDLDVVAGISDPGHSYDTDTITRIETNIDDLSPEITGALLDKLLTAGALDVFFTPIQMKKNRPGVLLTALCHSDAVTRIAGVIFSETTSFGLRFEQVNRFKLDRRFEKVQTPFGEITIKVGLRSGDVIQVAPEFESVRAASEKSGQPLRVVHQAALDQYKAASPRSA